MLTQHRAMVTLFLVGSVLALATLMGPALLRASTMTFPRTGHTATLLADGRVLAVGGDATGAELYNPATDSWSLSGAMRFARRGHAAVRLADGRVLVVGGTSSSLLAEIYDPSTDRWNTTSAMDIARTSPGVELLSDGRVLVIGGSNWEANNEIYDPATGNWSPVAANPGGPHNGSPLVARLTDGRLLVIGGGPATVAEIYNPQTDTWVVISLIEPVYSVKAAPLLDGRFLIIGITGTNTQIVMLYNPVSGAVTRAANPPYTLFEYTLTPLSSGNHILMTGLNMYGFGNTMSSRALLYDSVLNRWIIARTPTTPRRSFTATLLKSGLVLFAGGYDDNGLALRNAELYDPAASALDNQTYLPQVNQPYPVWSTPIWDLTTTPTYGPTVTMTPYYTTTPTVTPTMTVPSGA